ncbi:MAG TPA: MOSC domain-containing protein [Noviherbaspirillum sp.]|uniref:MOSC domain-containing protein n=1 Tax=Noviherbaspirillum sp. TaxID=1926288 RepID=UPI002D2EE230|nr:MOSC domain-containing protein [Noviherbaspirillum sp.]HYD97022.1 MOSC domain-containing protein [Noviherbaspirillum sp.]
MKLVSVNVATAGELFIPQSGRARRIVTGIHKQPVPGPVQVNRLGLDGDEQADLTVHGGLNKAVYAYPSEHYAFWATQRLAALKREEPLPWGMMGENLTLQGIAESAVWVGDRLQIGGPGGVLLEVTEPRQPCFKFNAKMGFSHAAKMMLQAGCSGFYLRVVETGMLQAGDAVVLLPGPRQTSIAQINERRRTGRQRDLF